MARPAGKVFPGYPRKPHSTGSSRIWLAGHWVYLGPHGSERSWVKYRRLLAEWQASRAEGTPGPEIDRGLAVQTVADLIALYLVHVRATYRGADGQPSSEVRDFISSAAPLLQLHGHMSIGEFGPLALKAVRQAMIDATWLPEDERKRRHVCRKTANQRVQRLKRMWRWGVEEELIDVTLQQRIESVQGLRAGRTSAVEHPDVQPVDPADVDAVLPRLGPIVRAMVRVQRLTGMRPGEICGLTPGEIDRSGKVWVYRPTNHKNAWRGHRKAVVFGPQAQALLAPFVDRADDAAVFSPAEEVAAVHADRRAKAKAPRRVLKLRRKPGRAPRTHYTTDSYGKRIKRACVLAGVEPWSPHQLRHLAEVEIERAFGLDAARAVLGHRSAKQTLAYGIQDLQTASKVATAMG